MKILIVGTGGVGGYFGGRLAKAGFDVTFVARGSNLKAIKENGLTVKSIMGDFHINNVKATDNIKNCNKSDLILICTKAWQLKDIRKEIKEILHDDSIVIPLQNGVQSVEELRAEINSKNILGGLCRIFSKIESPGVIIHLGVDPEIVFGETDKSSSERTEKIKQIFDKAGINSRISFDIDADAWKKFILICTSGLQAVTRATYGEIRELPQTREMMICLLTEIYNLSQKIGINIKKDFVDKTTAVIDEYPPDVTTSLARDVWEGKPSEIEYQGGAVVHIAEKYGVDVPINKFVYNCILPMEKKARAKAGIS